MVNRELLERMACSELADMPPDRLEDITEAEICGETACQRLESYLSQVRNPYCFRVGKTAVRISFCEEGKPLEAKLRSYFMGLKANTSPGV